MINIPWTTLTIVCIGIFFAGFMVFIKGLQELRWWTIIGVAMLVIGFFGASFCIDHRPFETTPASSWNTVEIQNISSLSGGDSFGISGRGLFFLGTGSATVNGNTRQVYTFFKVMPSGGYQKGTLDAEGVTVLEDAPSYPYIEWVYSHAKAEMRTYTDDGSAFGGQVVDKLMATYIHVPPGTVMREFKV